MKLKSLKIKMINSELKFQERYSLFSFIKVQVLEIFCHNIFSDVKGLSIHLLFGYTLTYLRNSLFSDVAVIEISLKLSSKFGNYMHLRVLL